MKRLGEKIRLYRFENRLTLRDLAPRLGISHTYLGKLERGIDERTGQPMQPSIDVLHSIAKELDISYTEVLELAGFTEELTTPVKSDGETTSRPGLSIDLQKKMEYVAHRYAKLSDEDRAIIDGILSRLHEEEER